ncbi:MAG: hypothetical protein Q8P64_04890, partial [Deltaproteobacteria bacterium]|nr:hypothetical protein [Deltaproteobacteria bacterium]
MSSFPSGFDDAQNLSLKDNTPLFFHNIFHVNGSLKIVFEILAMKDTFHIQWHITNLCNLRCQHCYQDDFSR